MSGCQLFLDTCKLFALLISSFFTELYHLFIPRQCKDIRDQTVLITGAGSGIGRLLATRFALRGANVVLLDINDQALRETASLVSQVAGNVSVSQYICDLSVKEAVDSTMKNIKSKHTIDILINNAGIISGNKLFWESSDELNIKTMQVNIMAHFWTVKALLPGMIERKRGHIVTVASILGKAAGARLADYATSKFAAVGLDEALRAELYVEGLSKFIKTTVICPCMIDTGMFEGASTIPILPVLKSENVADNIIQAVLTDKYELCIPSGMMLLGQIVKAFTPIQVLLMMNKLSGVLNGMDTFKGRQS